MEDIQLSDEERKAGCENMAEELRKKDYLCRVWDSPSRGGRKYGCGVEVRFSSDPENAIASLTITTKGYVGFQKIVDTLTNKQISALGDAVSYDAAFPVRPSPEWTKVLPQEEMNGKSRPPNPFLKK